MSPLRRRVGPSARAAAGSVLLAAGLLGLAIIPAAGAWWAVGAFGLCGAGFGLATGVLDVISGGDRDEMRRTGALAIGCRHAGLVLGLVRGSGC